MPKNREPDDKQPKDVLPAVADRNEVVLPPLADSSQVPGRVLSASETASTPFRPPSPDVVMEAMHHFSGLFSALDGVAALPEPEPREPDLRPVPVRTAVAKRGSVDDIVFDDRVPTRWHRVDNLPGFIVNSIKQMGDACFRPFAGNYPIGDMLMVTTLLNDKSEIEAVLKWMQSGQKTDAATLVFNQTGGSALVRADDLDPPSSGYSAKIQAWQVGASRLLLVRDFAGAYIYMWPQQDSGNKLT